MCECTLFFERNTVSTLYSILQVALVITASVAIIWFAEPIISLVERFVSFCLRHRQPRRMRKIDDAVQQIVQSYAVTFESFASQEERIDFLFYSGLANPEDAWSVTSRYVTHCYVQRNILQEDRDILPLFNDEVSIHQLLNRQATTSAQ